jgi:hypothetical protein
MTQLHDNGTLMCDTYVVTGFRRSADWLSDDMACALAATGPPLHAADVLHAADEVAIDTDAARVLSHLLQKGTDLRSARSILEALLALQEHAASTGPR